MKPLNRCVGTSSKPVISPGTCISIQFHQILQSLGFNTIYVSFSYLYLLFLKKRKHQKDKKYKSHRSPEFKSSRQTSDAQEFSFHPGFLSLCITRPCYQPFTFLYFYFVFTSLASWDNDQVNYPSIRQIGYCRSRPSVYPEPPPQITLGDLQDNRYVVADLCGTTGSDSTGSLLYYNDPALPLAWMGNDHSGIQ